jgi:hypothetical protein
VIISLKSIESIEHLRPKGYYEDVTSRGTIDDGKLHLEDSVYVELCSKYRVADLMSFPPLREQIQSLVQAFREWSKAGHPVCSLRPIMERYRTCRGCEFRRWKVLPRCLLCGCGVDFKILLQTEKCRANKWKI